MTKSRRGRKEKAITARWEHRKKSLKHEGARYQGLGRLETGADI